MTNSGERYTVTLQMTDLSKIADITTLRGVTIDSIVRASARPSDQPDQPSQSSQPEAEPKRHVSDRRRSPNTRRRWTEEDIAQLMTFMETYPSDETFRPAHQDVAREHQEALRPPRRKEGI